MKNQQIDKIFMKEALQEAKKAYKEEEVPVGAVIVFNEEIIGRGRNRSVKNNDPSSHAEVEAIRNASKHQKNYRLNDCTLYTTLEPCMMCAGLIIQARIKRVIYAALDPKSGVIESNDRALEKDFLNHKTEFCKGSYEEESSKLLKDFFKTKRN